MLPLRRLYPLGAVIGLLIAAIMIVTGRVGVPGKTLDLAIGRFASLDLAGATGVAMAVLALSSLGLLAGMRAVRAPLSGWPERLVLVWALSLAGVAAMPGTRGADLLMIVALVSLAAAAALMVRRFGADERWRPAARPLEWLALGAGGGLAVLVYVTLPGHQVMIGLVQSVLLLIEVAVLAVSAVQLARITWRPAGALTTLPAEPVAEAGEAPVTSEAVGRLLVREQATRRRLPLVAGTGGLHGVRVSR